MTARYEMNLTWQKCQTCLTNELQSQLMIVDEQTHERRVARAVPPAKTFECTIIDLPEVRIPACYRCIGRLALNTFRAAQDARWQETLARKREQAMQERIAASTPKVKPTPTLKDIL